MLYRGLRSLARRQPAPSFRLQSFSTRGQLHPPVGFVRVTTILYLNTLINTFSHFGKTIYEIILTEDKGKLNRHVIFSLKN